MAKCPTCKSKQYVKRCMECLHSETPKTPKGATSCEWPCSATIYVQDSLTGSGISGMLTYLGGSTKDTDPSGFQTWEKLKPGSHAARVSLSGKVDEYVRPPGVSDAPVVKAIAAGENEFYTFTLDPVAHLKVAVKRRHDSQGLAKAKVKITPGKPANVPTVAELETKPGGEITFERLRQDTYRLNVELDAPSAKKFELEKDEDHHVLDPRTKPNEHTLWVRLVIHLKLKYQDPDATVRCFPKDFPVTVAFNDGTTKDLKILDDQGYFKFQIEDDKKTKFTLKFDHAKPRYLVHEKDKPAELLEDLNDDKLNALNDAGKQFFALPKTWSLLQSTWGATHVVLPQDGQIVIPADGVGASDAPAELTLKPKLQYVRFQFFDRKYCETDHGEKQVSIPPIVLKGVRESAADATGTPQNPAAGTHDTISNWFVDKDDADNACQCLPWILTKTAADGADLPKLNNKMLLEFGRADTFVHSASATVRKLVVLPDSDDKRKPNRDRNQYYDLPKQWKSKCYFTRFSDPAKNKFFDELAAADDADLEASLAKRKKLTFSLDDVVLVSGASQAVKDKDETDADQPLSEHSRFTVLMLDPNDDKYKVVVHKPRAKNAYWSELDFQKEAAGTDRRNAIVVDLPINPRVVIFCDGFFDVYDKRTEAADFTKKELLGARAAKLEDTKISSVKTVLESDGDVTKNYVHLKRKFHMHYLHYAATDGTTVYGLLVTMWTCRFKTDVPNGGSDAVVTKFREEGMKRAMDRWNDKDYFFEEADDKQETKIKHFCLFEAKDVETSAGVFTKRGGKHICEVTVKDDAHGGSSAAADGTTMVMRRSGALDEGDGWGHSSWGAGPTTTALTPITEYDVGNAAPANAFAHELGHAAIGAWDDYVTGSFQYLKLSGQSTKLWMYNDKNESMDIEGQRYYGMPYEVDTGAIMKSNRSIRLRYFWGRANWLNDQAKAALDPLLAKKRFRIAFVPADASKDKLKFSKPDEADYRSIYKPIKTEKPYLLDKNGKVDLHLYHLSEDELAKTLNGGPYTGILAVCLKLSARFVTSAWAVNTLYKQHQVVKRDGKIYECQADHTPVPVTLADPPMDPTQWNQISNVRTDWASGTAYVVGNRVNRAGAVYMCITNHTAAADTGTVPTMNTRHWKFESVDQFTSMRITHLETLNQNIVTMLQDKFKLQGNGNFSTTYIRIFPQWEIVETTTVATTGTHFELEFTFAADTFSVTGSKVKAGTECKPKAIARYLFGKLGADPAQWVNEGGADVDMTKDDLPKIKSWMDTNANGRFNVGAI